MKCGICKKTSKGLIKCLECSSMFCEECGDKKRERCSLCAEFGSGLDNEDSSSDE
jgi:hypothetical protein